MVSAPSPDNPVSGSSESSSDTFPRSQFPVPSPVSSNSRHTTKAQSMVWRKCWLIIQLMLIAGSTTTTATTADEFPACEPSVWASDDGKWSVGDTGQVFCKCSIDSEPKGLSLRLHNTVLPIKYIDNGTTVQYTLPNAMETFQNEYECMWYDKEMDYVMIAVFPVLNVTDLSCRFFAANKLNCSFSRAGGKDFSDKIHYQLAVSSGSMSNCVPQPGKPKRMQCILETREYAMTLPTHTFTLNMTTNRDDDYETQIQQIELPKASVFVPEWPSYKANQSDTDNQTCLKWSNAQHLLNEELEWVVEMQPQQPGIQPLNLTLPSCEKTDYGILTFCFPHPPQGHQNFTVRLKMHLDQKNSLWSDYYPELHIKTADAVPARPPQFLPNGFSYDRDNNDLTVFWYQLEQVYHNGPNLTYTAYLEGTNEAEAAHSYSSSATLKSWDIAKPANVTLRSRNIKGVSTNSSWLWVPAINDVMERQSTNFKYHARNNTLTWSRPQDNGMLIGYTIYTCDASKLLGQFCKVGSPMEHISLADGKWTSYTFNDSMTLMDMALAPIYSDHVSGGMSLRLVAVEDEERKEFSFQVARIVEGIGALLVLGLVVISVKRLRKMSDINVEMPILFNHLKGPEEKPLEESPPQWGLPSNINPYYNTDIPLVSLELQTSEEAEEEEENEESFTEVATETEREPSSYVTMDRLPQINLNSNGYVLPSPQGLIPNGNSGYVAPPQPQLINNNGYVVAPQPRLFPQRDGYINPPPPRS